MGRDRQDSAASPWKGGATLLQWASETGAHGMPAPEELERQGWRRLARHPLFQGTWLMETPESRTAPVSSSRRARSRSAALRVVAEAPSRLG